MPLQDWAVVAAESEGLKRLQIHKVKGGLKVELLTVNDP